MSDTKLAVVFPGQGSQSLGMLADIAQQYPEILQTFTEASDALGYDLWRLTQEGPQEKLDQTTYTQPALLAASVAIWRLLQSHHPLQPAFLAGHSLGEYSALVCANAVHFPDAVKLVAARGQYMQEAVAPGVGAMAAIIGLENDVVMSICQEAKKNTDDVIAPANFNSIGQVVIAGHKTAVLRAMQLAQEKGAKLVMQIPVSVPSHCALMLPAAENLEKFLMHVTFFIPQLPIINNVDVKRYETTEAIHEGLVKQLSMPVRWVEIIQQFANLGVTHIIECGPGKVLTGLNKRIDKQLQLMTTSDLASLENILRLGE